MTSGVSCAHSPNFSVDQHRGTAPSLSTAVLRKSRPRRKNQPRCPQPRQGSQESDSRSGQPQRDQNRNPTHNERSGGHGTAARVKRSLTHGFSKVPRDETRHGSHMAKPCPLTGTLRACGSTSPSSLCELELVIRTRKKKKERSAAKRPKGRVAGKP